MTKHHIGDTVTYRLTTGAAGRATILRVARSDFPIKGQTLLSVRYPDGRIGTLDARYIIAD